MQWIRGSISSNFLHLVQCLWCRWIVLLSKERIFLQVSNGLGCCLFLFSDWKPVPCWSCRMRHGIDSPSLWGDCDFPLESGHAPNQNPSHRNICLLASDHNLNQSRDRLSDGPNTRPPSLSALLNQWQNNKTCRPSHQSPGDVLLGAGSQTIFKTYAYYERERRWRREGEIDTHHREVWSPDQWWQCLMSDSQLVSMKTHTKRVSANKHIMQTVVNVFEGFCSLICLKDLCCDSVLINLCYE